MSVTARSLKNYQVEILAGYHVVHADEPVSAGGDDKGPNPYDLLLSALAACKIITVQMYAKRKEWPLDGIEVTLDISQIHAKDCSECENKENAKVNLIEVSIKFSGDLTDEQTQRLKEISEKCPVHRTLTAEIVVRTNLLAD